MHSLITRAAAAALVTSMIAFTAGVTTASMASAAPAAAGSPAVTCPTVVPGGVSPAPVPGVDWSGCDLSGADLSFADLADANLTDASLTSSNLNRANLTGANLAGANLDAASLTDTTLTGVNLTGANLAQENSAGIIGTPSALPANWILVDGVLFGPQAAVLDVNLSGIDLSGADLAGAVFISVNLTGANLSGSDLSDDIVQGVTLSNADLSGTNLSGADLSDVKTGGITGTPSALPANWILRSGYLAGPRSNLVGAQLAGVNLSGADLAGAELGGADLAGASLADADLANSGLSGANLGNTDFSGATLSGVLSGAITGTPVNLPASWQLLSGYLVGPGANLSRASMPGADLSGLTLTGTIFNVANLAGADLTGADLTDAKFDGANLTGTKLAGAALGGVSGYEITGSPASLPANWLLISGFLVGPGADLSTDNLTGLDLADDDLAGANFTGSNLTDANLNGASVTPANFSQAIWSNTICPDGTNSNIYLDGCFSRPDTIAPVASPSIYSGLQGANAWYTSDVMVFWGWTDNVAVDPADCTQYTSSTGNGKLTLTATCSDYAGNVGHASLNVDVDTTRPTAAVTGVRAGLQYVLGKVPAAGCASTETVSGIATPAALALTTTGHDGIGPFTATCAGAVSVAGSKQAAPVSVMYTVVDGFAGFSAPSEHVRLHRGVNSVAASFRLVTAAGAPISAASSRALAAAHDVEVILSGSGIKPVIAACSWKARTSLFRCVIRLPARIRKGRRYSITALENAGGSFVRVPAVGKARNPQAIYFS